MTVRTHPANRKASVMSQGAGFVLPAAILFCVTLVAPILYIFYFRVQDAGAYSLSGYKWIVDSALFARVFMTTLEVSVMSTAVSVILGYMLAYFLYTLPSHRRPLGLVFVLLPFWTSILVKSYSFTIILGRNGLINDSIGRIIRFNPELPLIFNRIGVLIGMSNYLIPFVVFPVLANLLNQDRNLLRAAAIMGAHPLRSFLRVTLPLSAPAIAAGTLMCLIISFGFFVTPALLGGRDDVMLAN